MSTAPKHSTKALVFSSHQSQRRNRRVLFRATAKLKRGETLCVVGNTSKLGSGRIKRAMELVTSPKEFPVWFSPEPISVPDKAIVEYKYFICSGGKFSRWEPFEGHRTIPAYTEGSLHDFIIHDSVSVSQVASVNSGTEARRADAAALAAEGRRQVALLLEVPARSRPHVLRLCRRWGLLVRRFGRCFPGRSGPDSGWIQFFRPAALVPLFMTGDAAP